MTGPQTMASRMQTLLMPDRIRTKLLGFAVVVAMVPALATGWASYITNKRTLREKIDASLEAAAPQAARETDLWLKERLWDLRVFAASYEVTEPLERSHRAAPDAARPRLSEYLSNVRERFTDYLELQAHAADGRVLASSPSRTPPLIIPPEGVTELRAGRPVFGRIDEDTAIGATLTIAVPVATSAGQVIGSLVARLRLHTLDSALTLLLPAGGGNLVIVDRNGALVPILHGTDVVPDSAALGLLLQRQDTTREFRGHRGAAMLGAVSPINSAPWIAVAEVPQAEAYRALIRLRNVALLAILALALALGLVGYVIGLYVVRPIDSLTQAATGVAAGDLGVELPVVGRDEVASLTTVFNDMVQRLREGRKQIADAEELLKRRNAELEQLSITDGLTGLRNRRHIMATLEHELARATRTRRPLAVLMLDVDHFKLLNDRFGHLAGDGVLAQTAGAIRSAVRGMDYAARYGGEEFLVVLPETDAAAAREVAERIRRLVRSMATPGGPASPVTMSIGVAVHPRDGNTVADVLTRADAALYRAKEQGRDRVEVTVSGEEQPA